MKKTIGLVALLISSAAVLVQPALAQDRDDYRHDVPQYTPVRRDVRPDYRINDRQDRRDYRRVDVQRRGDFDRR